ncbi:MAG: MoxR family ATPase [Acidobacteriota bacterium]
MTGHSAPETTAPDDSPKTPPESALATRLLDTLDRHVLGQRDAAEQLLACYLAGGHALLEGVPGIGKTLLARCFSAALGLDFQRVQFTPDLMPSDVVGTNVFDQDSGNFRLVRGPIFTEGLMADEINRTPPKTQAALLEAMQELHVTIDGERHALSPSFFVIATQNPVEFEGTYPLPEAQLDRFLLRIEMALPSRDAEIDLYRQAIADRPWGHDAMPEAQLTAAEAAALRRASRSVHVADELLDYLYRLVDGARRSPHLDLAVSPRGALALLETARSFALIEGRGYVVPDDVKRGLLPCWGHRLLLGAEAELEGHSSRRVLDELAATVEVPHRADGA